jgi:hypothetical protein
MEEVVVAVDASLTVVEPGATGAVKKPASIALLKFERCAERLSETFLR